MLFILSYLKEEFIYYWRNLINYLYPSSCIACKELLIDDNLFCSSCWKDLNFISTPFCYCCGSSFEFTVSSKQLCGKCIQSKNYYDYARSLFKFDQFSKKLIHNFKYYDQTYHAKIFAKLLSNKYLHEINNFDLIIPVPMFWLKRVIRMYNQAELLADQLSIITNVPINKIFLIKNKWTKPQTGFKKKIRLQNINNSLKIRDVHNLKDKKVILVDDVLTTGATINECSRLLKQAGVREILVLTIAKT